MRLRLCPSCKGAHGRWVQHAGLLRGRETWVDCARCAGAGWIDLDEAAPAEVADALAAMVNAPIGVEPQGEQ